VKIRVCYLCPKNARAKLNCTLLKYTMFIGWTIESWLRLSLIPATIYFVQNMCSLLAYQNLDAITYNVLNQTKTLSAALFCYLLMKRKQSSYQMVALLLLLVAALVMEKLLPMDMMTPSYWVNRGGLSTDTFVSSLSPRHFYLGVLPIMVASFLSGLAGAITQINLQGGNRDALLFTVELCAATIIIILGTLLTSEDGSQIRERGFFDEWTLATLVPIFTNSAGGILVGLVIKYAGTVRKGFALIFGIMLTGMVQSYIEKRPLSIEKVAGGVLAAVSLWMHASYPYVEEKSPSHSSKRTKTSGPTRQTTRSPTLSAVAAASAGSSKTAPQGRGRKSRKED
jgi:UDP-sugar transporter A1/2/3